MTCSAYRAPRVGGESEYLNFSVKKPSKSPPKLPKKLPAENVLMPLLLLLQSTMAASQPHKRALML